MANHDLQMLLPKNIPTLCGMTTQKFTCLDNVLVSSSLQAHILECKTSPETCPPRTDHIPIITTLNMNLGRQEETCKPNFKSANWTKFQKVLTEKLANLNSQHKIQNKSEFYRRLNALRLAITDTIELEVPWLRPSPYTKWWWSKELSQKRTEVQKLGRSSYTLRGHPNEPAHRTYKTARNQYGMMIKMAKRTH